MDFKIGYKPYFTITQVQTRGSFKVNAMDTVCFSGATALPNLGISEFARRYSKESNHPHFEGTWEELLGIIQAQWAHRIQSPNNTFAVTVPIPPEWVHRFYATSVKLTPGVPLRPEFSPRRPGEDAFLKVFVTGQPKTQAQSAEIVLYQPGGLDDLPAGPKADYYIVAIKAYPTPEREPMDPITMARNFLEKPGGTKATYSAQEFAHAIWYWSQWASVEG